MVKFNEQLKIIRKQQGKTQKEVAVSIGIGESNYQNLEYGKSQPLLKTLVNLADCFDVSLDYLVGRSDNPMRY